MVVRRQRIVLEERKGDLIRATCPPLSRERVDEIRSAAALVGIAELHGQTIFRFAAREQQAFVRQFDPARYLIRAG